MLPDYLYIMSLMSEKYNMEFMVPLDGTELEFNDHCRDANWSIFQKLKQGFKVMAINLIVNCLY